ncbi:ecto-ADP-ribosyltransferase 4 precursor [Danio rerio]|uniref:NAD(P)(+)--arginine ADP-ribosyltransferase n=1 Tax=Danio rerio TaxID=7955 RepID=E7F1D1_DANRE|nr:ecto-ADP-ribosyltransferase 4 precursor [Danio rerio]|eukprot:NP_001303691.1 ecto-ADP-ribosyltransferase 4 precursor [Danio rerio]
MEILCFVEALLLILAALVQDHSSTAADGQSFPLDMALSSVDDQYEGCSAEMATLVKTEFLEKERSASANFNKAWQEAEENSVKPEDNLTRNHSIAIHIYTNKDAKVYSSLNSATRTGKHAYTDGTFAWHSLHFLLTDAIQILKKTQDSCYLAYRGTSDKFELKSEEVRLGSFASSSLDRAVIQEFGNTSCFEIYTCEGADLTKYSKYPEEKEVLIPPYERFRVVAVRNQTHEEDLWCETVFVLNSSSSMSDLNCALFNSGHHTAFCKLLLIVLILFYVVFTC